MNRRNLLLTTLAGGITLRSARAFAQEATPTPSMGIPPLRWELRQIASNNRVERPENPTDYWIQLLPDGTLWLKADCNQGGGVYTLDGESLTFGELISTKVACAEDSLSDRFLSSLGYVVSYQITGELDDQLVLQMMADGGELTFQPVLTGVVWQWVRFEGGDGSVVTAADPSRYTLAFLDDGSIQLQADCNRGKGNATIDGSSLDLTAAVTRMACPGDTQDADFLRYVDEAVSFVIRDGMLHISLPADAGIASFQPVVPADGNATPAATS